MFIYLWPSCCFQFEFNGLSFNAEKVFYIISLNTAFSLLSIKEQIADSLAQILVAQQFCYLLELYINYSPGQQVVCL